MKYSILVLLLTAGLAFSCEDSAPAASASADVSESVRGILSEQMEGIILPVDGGGTLYRCNTAEPIVFSDNKNLLRRALADSIPFGATLMGSLELAVAKDAEGFELKSVGALTDQWWSSSCIMVQRLQALGNEPGWELRIDPPNELVLISNYGEDEASFPFVLPKYVAGTWTYQITVGLGEDSDSLMVEISDQPCSDNMAGAGFPMTATVNHNGMLLQGCARDLAQAPQIR